MDKLQLAIKQLNELREHLEENNEPDVLSSWPYSNLYRVINFLLLNAPDDGSEDKLEVAAEKFMLNHHGIMNGYNMDYCRGIIKEVAGYLNYNTPVKHGSLPSQGSELSEDYIEQALEVIISDLGIDMKRYGKTNILAAATLQSYKKRLTNILQFHKTKGKRDE